MPSGLAAQDQLGSTVALDGAHALVGAPDDDHGLGTDAGSAYAVSFGAGSITLLPTAVSPGDRYYAQVIAIDLLVPSPLRITVSNGLDIVAGC